jgi:hypothetical protein
VRRAFGVALGAAIACFVWHRAASAAGSQVVILYGVAPDGVVQHAEMRLAAELRAAGFQVDERPSEDAPDARQAVEQAAQDGAFATVLLRSAPSGAFTDVWVADHVTRKTVVRRIVAGGVGASTDRALALRVVELMRASLVEGLVMDPSDGARDASPPPPDVVAWTREVVTMPPERLASAFDIGLGVACPWAGPDLGVAVGPELRVAWRSNQWSVGLLAVGPAFGARVAANEGSATVRQELALLEAAVEPWSWGPIAAQFSLGGGAYHVATTGTANPPYSSLSSDAWSALLSAGVGARLPLSPSASLVLTGRELFAMPRPVVAFAGQEVAASMRPGTLVALLLSVSLR